MRKRVGPVDEIYCPIYLGSAVFICLSHVYAKRDALLDDRNTTLYVSSLFIFKIFDGLKAKKLRR